MAWAPDYVTVSGLADYLRIGDDEDDTELSLAISAASRAVDLHCNRQFGKVAEAEERIYTAAWDRRRLRWLVSIDDLGDVTGLDVQSEAGPIDSFKLYPRNAPKRGRPFTLLVVDPASTTRPSTGEHEVTVTGLFGWTSVPDPVKQATLLQASRFHARRFSPYGIAGSAETGSELRLMQKVDPDVGVTLGPFIRWWGAV